MRKVSGVVLLILLLLMVSPAKSFGWEQWIPGIHTVEVLHDNIWRWALVYVPPQYNPSKPTPIILVYHGAGGKPVDAQEIAELNNKANEVGCLVFYMRGTESLEGILGSGYAWNAFEHCCFWASERGIDDIGFTETAATAFKILFNVSGSQVYATGMSNGAMMAFQIGTELSGIFAAVAPVAGSIGVADGKLLAIAPLNKISFLIMNGYLDPLVPYDGGTTYIWNGPYVSYDFGSITRCAEFLAEELECPLLVDSRSLTSSGNVTQTIYSDMNGTDVMLDTFWNEGHVWFGMPREVAEKNDVVVNSWEVKATDEIWNFFKSHPKSIPLITKTGVNYGYTPYAVWLVVQDLDLMRGNIKARMYAGVNLWKEIQVARGNNFVSFKSFPDVPWSAGNLKVDGFPWQTGQVFLELVDEYGLVSNMASLPWPPPLPPDIEILNAGFNKNYSPWVVWLSGKNFTAPMRTVVLKNGKIVAGSTQVSVDTAANRASFKLPEAGFLAGDVISVALRDDNGFLSQFFDFTFK